MRNVWLVMQREISVRVRRKAFVIITLITPLLFAALMLLPAFLFSLDSGEHYRVGLIDRSDSLSRYVTGRENMTFVLMPDVCPEAFEDVVRDSALNALVVVLPEVLREARGVTIYAPKTPSMEEKITIEGAVNDALRSYKMARYNSIPQLESIMEDVGQKAEFSTVVWSEAGEEKSSSTELVAAIGYVLGFVIYMMIFASGNMVMTGVMEEKSTRIVEVLASTVRSVDLMLGKILGVGAVMVLQLLLWGVLTIVFAGVAAQFVPQTNAQDVVGMAPMGGAEESFSNVESALVMARSTFGAINISGLLLSFLFFALFGYLLYAALFAAIGSAAEDQNDTGQLMLPVTIPLIVAMMGMFMVIKSPDGGVGFWLSLIPFTSPIIMPVRVAAGAPLWEVLLSGTLLVATMAAILWLAARIYRQGILRFGKKNTWRDMVKWVKDR